MTTRSLTIGNFTISDDSDCYVIAEVGNNHQGEMAKAIQAPRATLSKHAPQITSEENLAAAKEESLYCYYAPDTDQNDDQSVGRTIHQRKRRTAAHDRKAQRQRRIGCFIRARAG